MREEMVQQWAGKFLVGMGEPNLVYHAGAWYMFSPRAGWCVTDVEMILDEVVKSLWEGAESVSVSQNFSRDVLGCLRATLRVHEGEGETVDPSVSLAYESFEQNMEIGVLPAEGWIFTRSNTLHVPTVAAALHAGGDVPAESVSPADTSLFTRGMVPCEFNPAATCPRWEQFVAEACPEDAAMLQMMFGLSLTYDRRYNVFFVIHGEAGTGKSTALDVLARLNAGAVCGVPLSMFGEKFRTYDLTEHRLNMVQDMESVYEGVGSVSLREAILKSCTAGEKFQVEQKHQPPKYRRLTALPVFGGNVLPRFADRSRAIADRMRIITFPCVFRGTAGQDLTLADSLRAELPGILNWALRGYGMLLAGGSRTFPETASAAMLKADLIKSARPEELFCDDMLEVTPDGSGTLSTEAVYLAYQAFCIRNGFKPVGSSRVIPEICRYLGVEKMRSTMQGKKKTWLFGVRFPEGVPPAENGQGTDGF